MADQHLNHPKLSHIITIYAEVFSPEINRAFVVFLRAVSEEASVDCKPISSTGFFGMYLGFFGGEGCVVGFLFGWFGFFLV